MGDKVVVAIVNKGSDILLIKRILEKNGLLWVFPGGKIEPGENEQEAVRREVLEETSIECEPIERMGERIHPDTQKHIVYWIANYVKGEVKSSDEDILDVCWLTPNNVMRRITSDLFDPIKDYIEKLSKK